MAAGMALFGSATPISKLVGAAFPAMLASELRMLTAVAVLAPVLAIRRVSPEHPPPKLSGRDLLLLAGIAVIGTFAFTLLLFYGMREAPGTVGAVVMATTPMVTAVGAVVFLGDRLTRWKLLGLVLAVSGIVVVNLGGAVTDTGDAFLLGSLLVFCAVCCEAAYTLLGKRLTADLSPVAIAVWAAVGAAVLFAPFAVVQGSRFDWSTPSPGEWLAVVWWGAATMGLGSVLWFLGVQKVAATTASGFMAVMPVSALLLAYVLLDERFSWLQPVGMAVVLSGLAAVVYGDAIAGRPAEPRAARGGR
jgi:drug/metabolite transporter (DMT)-like permease